MNSIAENTLYIYLIVFLSMLVFDLVSILYRKVSNKNIKFLVKKLEDQIGSKKLADISSKDMKKLAKNLKKIGYFIAFTNVVDNMPDENEKNILRR